MKRNQSATYKFLITAHVASSDSGACVHLRLSAVSFSFFLAVLARLAVRLLFLFSSVSGRPRLEGAIDLRPCV